MADSTGAVIFNGRLSYDAWGKRRNPDGTPAACGSLTTVTTRGFTGQEMMDVLRSCAIDAPSEICGVAAQQPNPLASPMERSDGLAIAA